MTEPLSHLTVDLVALQSNYAFLRSKLKPGADCAGVIKADAYGLGADRVAPSLYAGGCRIFFTAHLDEAIRVNDALSGYRDFKIFVLHGFAPDETDTLHIHPVISSPKMAAIWSGQKKAVILHIDTGMNRLGLSADELGAFSAELNLDYIMSHLACADEPDHPMNTQQIAAFEALTKKLPKAKLSLANSAGIFLGAHYDLVRPGIALYGGAPVMGVQNPMKPVVGLQSKILQIRSVKAGETIGYGATFKAQALLTAATVSLGYADGFFRSLSGVGNLYINGTACPLLGRVSMDLVVIDVSAVKKPPVEGDWVEILGNHQKIDDLAKDAGTISYEILTSLGKRYKRNYIG